MKLFRNILSLLLVGFLLIASMLLFLGSCMLYKLSRDAGNTFFGCRFYNVLSQSMQPAIKPGSMIIVKPCQPEAVRVGDIIMFNPYSIHGPENTGFLTHRVVGVLTELGGETGLWFVTKGDANTNEDPPITVDMLVGKVTGKLPGMGHLIGRLGPVGMGFVSALLLLGLCLGIVLHAIRIRELERKQRNEQFALEVDEFIARLKGVSVNSITAERHTAINERGREWASRQSTENTYTTSLDHSSEQPKFDWGHGTPTGTWRSPGQGFIDPTGTWRNPGQGFIDWSGTWRGPGQGFIDASGTWRSPGQGFIDSTGTWRDPGQGFIDWSR